MTDDKTGGTITLGRPRAPDVHALRVSVVRGVDRGSSVVVDRRGLIVGRAVGVGLRLSDIAVSSFHVELAARPDGILVHDLSSHNGTFFAGARLVTAVVPEGSTLEVGASFLQVELEERLAVAEGELASFGPLRGGSALSRTVFSWLARLAPTDVSVLLEGATGTGKELAARAMHESSRRSEAPFLVLDCAAVPAALVPAALFGDERNPGALEAAGAGTLFLKDVASLSRDVQSKLSRALEAREMTREGTVHRETLRARVVAGTRHDLREPVNAGSFDEELYLRLAQARVVLAPLSERTEDIVPLVYHFLQSLPAPVEGARTIAREALDELKRREYRGNVRELRSTVERASLLARGQSITAGDLAFEKLLSAERERGAQPILADLAPFKEAKQSLVDDFEHDYLKALLLRAGENLSRASALSGIERHHLRNLFRKHSLWDK